LTDREEAAWRAYRRMRTLLDLAVARDLRADSALSDSDYDVLSTLSEATDGGWRAGELSRRLMWSTSRLAHQVGRMEKRGLVARRGSSDDARGAYIELTAEGRAVLRTAAVEHVESVRRNLIDLLTPEEIGTLKVIADKVVTALE
jgi:DNA-binding MarR family transcriptional regulator